MNILFLEYFVYVKDGFLPEKLQPPRKDVGILEALNIENKSGRMGVTQTLIDWQQSSKQTKWFFFGALQRLNAADKGDPPEL